LSDIYDILVETYEFDPNFKADLDEVLKAIRDRIELIKKCYSTVTK
jgi:hypothetical protein